MITFANVLPKQTSRIPWGWENTTVPGGEWASATYVSKPLGCIRMPDLLSAYDWNTFIIEGTSPFLGTRNMKSVFTTAARFLGYERLLAEQPALHAITDGFLAWNRRLLGLFGYRLAYFMLGDDVAGNTGLFMDPALWRTWVFPEQKRLMSLAHEHGLQTIWHSDGDVSAILPDLLACSLVDVINYEAVGGMQAIRGKQELFGKQMELVHDQTQRHENSMELQR